MRLPVIQGLIDRRILANYRVEPDVLRRVLPAPFRPQIVNGFAVAGICLIRLKHIRPSFMPLPLGISSENAAHRIAVEWDQDGQSMHGVYIPRRDTNSRLNAFAGGWLFPGEHHHAGFSVEESAGRFSLSMNSDDGQSRVVLQSRITNCLPGDSVFASLEQVSNFFASGSLGYSVTAEPGRFDGLELRCETWNVTPLAVEKIESSFFDKRSVFPAGSIHFDCALLMRDIRHEWHGRQPIDPVIQIATMSRNGEQK